MSPKRTGSATLKSRPSRSRITKSSYSTPKTTTPRKTKSRSSTNTRPDVTPSKSAPMRTRQKKKVSTSGTPISPIHDSPELSHSPPPPRPDHTTPNVNTRKLRGRMALEL
ncbi:uncharacterized protein DFL_007912 [Arthrobotrys flagrans]|uniref:Uncharacterized protein n=1 Tax=Arthrobotrys flagrans TaxID=97331 RepID=A0A436ZXQ3_ARTFL|nr:hypothetical protein DFL_007912 [Arthrobotrys flagrans]